MSYLRSPTLLDRNEMLNQLYLDRGIVFQNAVMEQLKAERTTEASSSRSPSFEVDTENENNTPLAGEGLQYQTPRLFALIIGINVYQMGHKTLLGAVPDGKAFKTYLIKRLCVPKDHIITLFDHEATRTEIIKGFQKLRDNPKIKEGDPIFIFYAGHGSQKFVPPSWGLGTRNVPMEVILPYDCGAINEENPKGVEPIPDHTMGILIDEIAAKKGTNITVVFDSCHSASGTRSENENTESLTLVRSAQLEDVPFREETDCEIRRSLSRSARPHDAHSRRGLGSHMLISACNSKEDAIECNGRGKLSTALLKLLDNTSPDKLRYRDILAKMEPIPPQNPQCEGHAQDRLLFNGKVLLPRGIHPIRFDNNTSKFTLGAGAAHGIAIGAEFTAYSDPDKLLNPLGIFVVERLWPFKADMKLVTLSGIFPTRGASAIQTKEGEVEPLCLYIPLEDRFHGEYHSIQASQTAYLRGVSLVKNPEEAHLKVCASRLLDGHLTFFHMDSRVTRHGMHLVEDGVKSDPVIVGEILETAARYFRELNRTTAWHGIAPDIKVEFYKLAVPRIRNTGPIIDQLKPVGPNLCHQNVIDFVVEDPDNRNTPYGFKIINNTNFEEDLYVNAFYFDNTDFGIVPCYITNSTSGEHNKLESPLKRKGELCVGYGPEGWRTLTYNIRKGQDLDVGFLKIYLSTQPVDLSGIQQQSAFLANRSAGEWHPEPQSLWDTVLIPIIQRRNPRSS